MERLLQDIVKYIDFLRDKGLYITVHGQISEFMYRLSNYNIHYNPFCVLVKSDDAAWQRCIQSQQKIKNKMNKEPFWGMCHAGIEEYIFPVPDTEAFVCVSGYAVNDQEAKKRIAALSKEFFLDKQELLEVYQAKLSHTKPNLEEISVVVKPLCHMLCLLERLKPLMFSRSDYHIYNEAMIYLERNFAQNIRLADIADYCNCSVSSLCHVFKQSSGLTIKTYITSLRMKNAANLLKNSALPINSVAELCGFADSDYFSVVFKKIFSLQPTEYRKNNS